MRRTEIGNGETWLVTECRGCPWRFRDRCSKMNRELDATVRLPDWCPLEKVQGWNDG